MPDRFRHPSRPDIESADQKRGIGHCKVPGGHYDQHTDSIHHGIKDACIMDDQDLELDFEDLGGDPELDADAEVFYWALKAALERTQIEPPPAPLQ